jgi:anaerobic selenocysteine-containing dehydrogenase
MTRSAAQIAITCPFCGVGCGLVLGVADGRVTDVRPQAWHPVSRGQLCAKGWDADKFLADPDRLTTPLVRRGGQLEPVSWDVALEAAADVGRPGEGPMSVARAVGPPFEVP